MPKYYYAWEQEGPRFGSASAADGSTERREFVHWFLGPKYMDADKSRDLIASWETQRLSIHKSEFTDFLPDTRGPMMLSERLRDIVEARRHPEHDTFVWLPAIVEDEHGEKRNYFYAFFPEWPDLYIEQFYLNRLGKKVKTHTAVCERVAGRALFLPYNLYDFNLVVSAPIAYAAVDAGCIGVRFDGFRCVSEATGEVDPPFGTKTKTLRAPKSTSTQSPVESPRLDGTDVSDYLEKAAAPRLAEGAWELVESDALAAASEILSDDDLKQVRDVSLDAFEEEVYRSLKRAHKRVDERKDVSALYWEFDPHNTWANAVDLCASYDEDDPDWAADSIEFAEGPELPEFADIYKSHGWADTPEAAASSLAMVARTFAAFGRAYDRAGRSKLPFGVSIHDTSLILMLPSE